MPAESLKPSGGHGPPYASNDATVILIGKSDIFSAKLYECERVGRNE
jgi:hypothetical protein